MLAKGSDGHALSGKAYARAIRAHFIIALALNSLLFGDILDDTDVAKLEASYTEATQSDFTSNDRDLIKEVAEKLSKHVKTLETSQTAKLWLLYIDLVEIAQTFIKAERTGSWHLHLQCVRDMLTYVAASGHNLYCKSGRLYLQDMSNLHVTHPRTYAQFMKGLHVIRRSHKFWAGLSTDLAIEQILMRSMKCQGGLTRSRGINDHQRSIWLLSMPARASVNIAMQDLTEVAYVSSEQHKDMFKARMKRDYDDAIKVQTYLKNRDPFSLELSTLQNISTGQIASDSVTVVNTLDIGMSILKLMDGNNAGDYVLKKKNQAVTMSKAPKVNIAGEDVQIDADLLFQRLVAVLSVRGNCGLQDAMKTEMSVSTITI